MTDDVYRLRTLDSADDYPVVAEILADAFGDEFTGDADDEDRGTFEPERCQVVEHPADGPVAVAGAYSREVTVPGAVLPGGHVTLVGVRPTHRRHGLATRLMHHQLADIGRRGEPIALLWASEGRIYQRFGYGLAAQRHSLTVDLTAVRPLRPVDPAAGRLRDAPPEQVHKDLQLVYERCRPTRPGWSSRDDRWWSRRLMDRPRHRGGYSRLRALLFDGPEGVDGYALWRRKPRWDGAPRGEIEVRETVSATPAAYTAIWNFLLDVDLCRTLSYYFAAPDEPVRYLVDEPRMLGGTVGDTLWVRVVDLPAALAARRYAAPVDLVLDVSDPLLPGNAGRWRLTGDPAGARCVATADPADLACDVADLGALYLGGTPVGALAAAGRVREVRPGAAARAAAAFGWQRAPSALEVF